jgi:hypothetical protein
MTWMARPLTYERRLLLYPIVILLQTGQDRGVEAFRPQDLEYLQSLADILSGSGAIKGYDKLFDRRPSVRITLSCPCD